MARRAPKPAIPPADRALSPEELIFLNTYFSNGGNRVKAYQAAHPHAKYDTANSQGYRLFQKPHVKAEIARRTRWEAGISREFVSSRLLEYEAMAYAAKDYVAGASIAMDAAKLGGFLVEKREVKSVSDEDRTAIRSLVASCLPPSPTLSHEAVPSASSENGA